MRERSVGCGRVAGGRHREEREERKQLRIRTYYTFEDALNLRAPIVNLRISRTDRDCGSWALARAKRILQDKVE